jgi:hypothetical protein
MASEDYFRSILNLRELMLSENKLRVIHSHWVWTAYFAWEIPSSIQIVIDTERKIGQKIPEDLAAFVTSVSDGATLYRNTDDAMTGYKIYGMKEIIEAQERWKQSLAGLWLPRFLAIGEIVSGNRPIIMDGNYPTKDGKSCRLVEGNPNDPVPYWQELSVSFHTWIDYLITAQGAQYWLWR